MNFQRNKLHHQNGPTVKNGSFIKIRTIIIPHNKFHWGNCLTINNFPKKNIKPTTPEYRSRPSMADAVFMSLLNRASLE